MTGIDGIAAVTTSSPTSSTTGVPSSRHASTRVPSSGHCISPAYTGDSGLPPTYGVQTSVPPLGASSHTSLLTCSYTQCHAGTGSGEPEDITQRRLDRSSSRPGSSPARCDAVRYPALVPKWVAPVAAARRQSASLPGQVG